MALVRSIASSMSRTLATVTVGPNVSSCTAVRVLGYVDQDRRLHEPLAHRVDAADHGAAAAVERVLDVAADHVELAGHRDRADLGVGAVVRSQPRAPSSVSSARNSS